MAVDHATAMAEVLRIQSLAAKGLHVRLRRIGRGTTYDLDIQDSRITSYRDAALPYPTRNQAMDTDSFLPGSHNRYEVGSAVTYPNAAVTFT